MNVDCPFPRSVVAGRGALSQSWTNAACFPIVQSPLCLCEWQPVLIQRTKTTAPEPRGAPAIRISQKRQLPIQTMRSLSVVPFAARMESYVVQMFEPLPFIIYTSRAGQSPVVANGPSRPGEAMK